MKLSTEKCRLRDGQREAGRCTAGLRLMWANIAISVVICQHHDAGRGGPGGPRVPPDLTYLPVFQAADAGSGNILSVFVMNKNGFLCSEQIMKTDLT